MAKFETICCMTTWGLMNALFVVVAFGSLAPADRSAPAHLAERASVTTAAAA